MKPRSALRQTAETLLAKHKTPDAAATPFATLLETDADLRRAAAVYVLQSVAPKEPASRRRHGPHRRPAANPMPTQRQKQANLRAEMAYTEDVFARKLRGGKTLGEIHVHELRAIAKSSAEMATRFMLRGHNDAVDLFLCTALANHCVAADPFALVKDTIKAATVASIYEEAKRAASEALASSSDRLTQDLIDAADDRAPEPPKPRGRPPRQPTASAGARPSTV